MSVFRVLVALALGLIFGSFLTVVIYRVPRKESIVTGRSKCPSCGRVIAARDNMPVVSWILLRARCRRCGARISPFYPLVELATASLFAGAALAFDELLVQIMMAAFLAVMLAVAVIDVQHRIVPNRITYPALLVFAAVVVVGDLAGGGVNAARAGI